MNSKDALSPPKLKKKGTHNGMRQKFRNVTICLALMAIGAFSQTKPSFEVATIKPSQPMDQAKLLASLQSGGKLPIGANID
jgi:hypothetical protein